MLNILIPNKPPADTLSLTYTPEKGEYSNKSFTGYGKMTSDPFYHSREIKCFLKCNDKLSDIKKNNLPYVFVIDVYNKRYVDKDIKEQTPVDNKKFAENFAEQLINQDWKLLFRFLDNYKSYITDTMDIEHCKITATFPVYDIEKDGIMIGYNQILPFAEAWSYEDDKNYYLIADHYCLDPGCPCTEVVLAVVPWIGDKMIRDDEMRVRFDYQKNSWEMEDSPSNKQYHLDTLFPKIMKSIPNLTEQLKKRHELLKKIYNRYKKEKNILSQNIKKDKIGRNDPCPCGSGKKYKKCCGR